jgi:peptidoglycan/LPS O-acetylase OafA/YrhL
MFRSTVRWVLFLGFVAYGLYLLMWAFQSATLSVPLPDAQKAAYETMKHGRSSSYRCRW